MVMRVMLVSDMMNGMLWVVMGVIVKGVVLY